MLLADELIGTILRHYVGDEEFREILTITSCIVASDKIITNRRILHAEIRVLDRNYIASIEFQKHRIYF